MDSFARGRSLPYARLEAATDCYGTKHGALPPLLPHETVNRSLAFYSIDSNNTGIDVVGIILIIRLAIPHRHETTRGYGGTR